MLKKYTAILLTFTAYAILLAHNIIPHHHHDNHHHSEEDQQVNHHHHHEELNNLFSLFIHSADELTATTNSGSIPTHFKQMPSDVTVTYNVFFNQLPLPPLLYCTSVEHLVYIPPHFFSSGLRAPPVFIS